MRRFVLNRQDDPTGVSGTGIVAEGVEFSDGRVAIRWRTETAATNLYDSIADVEHVHGHGGATVIEWLDALAASATDEHTLRAARKAIAAEFVRGGPPLTLAGRVLAILDSALAASATDEPPTRFDPSDANRLVWDLRRAIVAGDTLTADQLHSKIVVRFAATATDERVVDEGDEAP